MTKRKYKKKICKLYKRLLITHRKQLKKFLETFPPEHWNKEF